MKIGIIGNGFVGKATSLLECSDVNIIVYDINPKLCNPIGTTLNDIVLCELIFISVPTPMNKDGSCHLDILHSVIDEINNIKPVDELLIINLCTVPIGSSNKINCFFMPEFLTEKNYKHDFINNPDWIFGLKGKAIDVLFIEKIKLLINLSYKNKCINYNKIHFITNNEAEMVKLFKNNFLATKIAFCNEIYQFTKALDINYETIRELSTRDPRISSSHTNVPGHDGKLGYGGTCFPKDTNNLLYQMNEKKIKSYVIKSVVDRNEKVDRIEQDWKQDKNRAYISK